MSGADFLSPFKHGVCFLVSWDIVYNYFFFITIARIYFILNLISSLSYHKVQLHDRHSINNR